MTQEEYEAKKRECWEEIAAGVAVETTNFLCKVIAYSAFDRGYALGKQTETITQEEIEKAAEEYAEPSRTWASGAETQEIKDAFKAGANFALGKQEKEAELHEVNFAKTDMEKINGIIKDGKVYVALQDGKDCFSCQGCGLYSEGGCIYSSLCFYLGRCNIFRYSPELTEKLNKI